MIFTFIAFVILSIARAIIVTEFDISPFTGAHMWLLVPDVAFFALICAWYFIREKGKATLPVILFFAAYLGSIVWDYQTGFYWLKFLVFPGILYILTHQEQYNGATIRQAITYSFPILHAPFVSTKQYFSEFFARTPQAHPTDTSVEIEKDTNPDTISFSLSKAIWFGIGLGLIILIALASLDKDFASFLQLTKWWDVIFNSLGSFVYYSFVFFWYFWKPIRTDWKETTTETPLNTLLHRAVVMIVAIFVGYTFYDAYIILRALKMIQLAFETVGRNAQLNFLELVILGGGWLFLVAYLVNKLKNKVVKKQSTIATIFMLLLVSCIWLLPPVMNILRVLLTVYIPMFGLTARRLFGIYTTIAFSLTFAYVLFGGMKKDINFFTKTTVTFFLTIILLSFAVPTNLLIADWHLSRYLKKDIKADFDYFKKLKLEKWGWIFQSQLDTKTYKSDIIWGLALAERQGDTSKQQEYKDMMKQQGKAEINEMIGFINNNNIQALVGKYSTNSATINKKVTSTFLLDDTAYIHEEFVNNLVNNPYITREYSISPVTFSINVTYASDTRIPSVSPTISVVPSITSYVTPTVYNDYKKVPHMIHLRFAEYRTDSTLFKIDNERSTKL